VSGALGAGRALSARIFRDREALLRSEPEREKLRADLTRQADRIERLCGESGSEPSALPTRTRLYYGWLRLLATDGVLHSHVRTVAGIADVAERTGVTGHVHLAAARTLWRRARRGPGILFTASEGYLDAPPEVLLALGGLVAGAGAGSMENLAARRYAESAPFAAVVRRIDAAVGGMDRPKGRHHDLAASFLRVNTEYFGGALARPPLRFGKFPSTRKVAHYEPAGGSIVFSALLDDPAVPELVIDNIMHHELLHLSLGVGERNGRRVVHGPGFRGLERRFAGYDEAERLLQEFLRRTIAGNR
jgi:hypothetical protein